MASHRAHIWEDNMKKTMQCKPAPVIELVTTEGETITLRFNVNMWANMQEIEGGLEALKSLSMPEICAVIVLAAGKDNNEDFTLEKAREIVAFLDISNVNDIVETFSESVGGKFEKLTDEQKKTLIQFLRVI